MPQRSFTCLLLVVGFLLMSVFPARAGEREVAEYDVKAAFLYNFAKFTDWPAGSFAGDLAPLTICVLGDNPFGNAFNSIRSKTIKNRPAAVREIPAVDAVGGCHVLFISASEQPRIEAILTSLGKRNVLTVSDMKQFAASGGMIGFVTVDEKIRFEINARASNRAGLNVSSQILKLARQIIE
jgi:YfiR/HmsC-like